MKRIISILMLLASSCTTAPTDGDDTVVDSTDESTNHSTDECRYSGPVVEVTPLTHAEVAHRRPAIDKAQLKANNFARVTKEAKQ